jgi:hypothetical protein
MTYLICIYARACARGWMIMRTCVSVLTFSDGLYPKHFLGQTYLHDIVDLFYVCVCLCALAILYTDSIQTWWKYSTGHGKFHYPLDLYVRAFAYALRVGVHSAARKCEFFNTFLYIKNSLNNVVLYLQRWAVSRLANSIFVCVCTHKQINYPNQLPIRARVTMLHFPTFAHRDINKSIKSAIVQYVYMYQVSSEYSRNCENAHMRCA